jgi:hypothetical protein
MHPQTSSLARIRSQRERDEPLEEQDHTSARCILSRTAALQKFARPRRDLRQSRPAMLSVRALIEALKIGRSSLAKSG